MKDDQGGVEPWGDGPVSGVDRCKRCLAYVRAVATFTISHIGLVSLVVGYVLVGASAFVFLEGDHEKVRENEMAMRRETFVEELWNITASQKVFNRSNWTEEVTMSMKVFETLMVNIARHNGTLEEDSEWSFTSALLYSIIVITTIGYGNVAPKTDWGKVVTILYAVIGIPLMLLCMSNIGDTLAQSFKFLYWKVCCYFCVRAKNNQRALTRARSLRYHRYPSTRSRGGYSSKAGGTSHLGPASASRQSSTRSGATLQGEGGSEAGSGESSGFYSGRGHDVDMLTDDVTMGNDPYSSRRRRQLNTTQQPQLFDNPTNTPKDSELNKVPIILNKYILESKEDLRVDLPLSTAKEHLTNSVAPSTTDIERHGHLRNLSRLSSRQRKQLQRIHMSHRGGNVLEVYNDSEMDLELEEELEEMSALEEVMDKGQVTVPIWVCCALVSGYIAGGTVLFKFWEGWEYLESAYFCFVTLSTIGFGDLVPGKNFIAADSKTGLALCALYLLFGMALLAMSFNLVQEQVTTAVKNFGQRLGIIDDEEDEDEE